jgi:hypothetical protein
MAQGGEPSQFSGPAAFADWLEDEASGLFSAHIHRGSGGVDGFTALRALEAQDVKEFAPGGIPFVGLRTHVEQRSGLCRVRQYPRSVIRGWMLLDCGCL